VGDTVATQPINLNSARGLSALPVAVGLTLAGFVLLIIMIWSVWNRTEVAPLPIILLAWVGLIIGAIGIGRIANWVVDSRSKNRLVDFLPAGLTFVLVVTFVEVLIRAFRIPLALVPAPSQVFTTLWTVREVLLRDAFQTFVLEALLGFLFGSAAGLLLALLVSRFKFLERGLLPFATVLSSVPIVALAPVIIKIVGLEWSSKAWVVAITVFFPVVVNAVRGLTEVNPMHLDLMRSYAASDAQAFSRLRVPNALPFVFNALKIGTTLGLIGAIVGEFFGATGSGLGFRIQIEAGRFSFDIVWAAIIVASVIGISFYNLVAYLERHLTGWHVSFRSE
jgi:NitT/TauT family transport system permease protein